MLSFLKASLIKNIIMNSENFVNNIGLESN